MKKSQFLVFAIYVGVLSFLLQLADQLLGRYVIPFDNSGFVFIGFFGWALYFLLGADIKGAFKVFGGFFMGIVFAVIMLYVGNFFSFTGIFAIPITALIIVPIMMYFEFAPAAISNVSCFFLGAGAFYGIYNYVGGVTIISTSVVELGYCIMGLACGWATVVFRGWYEKRLNIKH